MQSEYVYPALADRSSPKEWEELNKPILVEEAAAKIVSILKEDAHGRFSPELMPICAAITIFYCELTGAGLASLGQILY